MESLTLEKLEVAINKTMIGFGGEAEVYRLDENSVVKIFDTENPLTLKNKYNKIHLLNAMPLTDFVLPQKLVIDKNDNFIGYTMDYVKPGPKIKRFEQLDNKSPYSLDFKIAYLLRLESLIKTAHQAGIVMADISCCNSLIDETGTVKIIDTDNFKIGNYNCDVTSIYTKNYQANVSNIIDENTDKYSFGLLALELLSPGISVRPFLFSTTKENSLFQLINILDMNNETRESFYELFSDSKPKAYIGSSLKLLADNQAKSLQLSRKKAI